MEYVPCMESLPKCHHIPYMECLYIKICVNYGCLGKTHPNQGGPGIPHTSIGYR